MIRLIHLALPLLILLLSACTAIDPYTGAPPADAPDSELAMPEGMNSASRSLLEQSEAQRAAGNLPQAAATLERALRIDPNEPALWIALGRVRLLQGNDDQAEQMGLRALSLSSGSKAAETESRRLLGDALRSQGRETEAVAVEKGR